MRLLPTEILKQCPFCGHGAFSKAFEPDICRCHACGLHFRNPRPDESAVVESYNTSVTFDAWQQELEIRAHLWEKRLKLVARHRDQGSLLDVGTGDGYFLEFAKARYEVDATEISESGVAYAKKRGHHVHLGTIFNSCFDARSYDVITMWHVLEHVPDPAGTLRRAKSLLKPGGLLFIAVPNETVSLQRAYKRRRHPFGPLASGMEIHLTHFTPRVLTNGLRRLFGFSILRLDVDDVHVHNRREKLSGFYINKVMARLFNWHRDTAMVVVCARPG